MELLKHFKSICSLLNLIILVSHPHHEMFLFCGTFTKWLHDDERLFLACQTKTYLCLEEFLWVQQMAEAAAVNGMPFLPFLPSSSSLSLSPSTSSSLFLSLSSPGERVEWEWCVFTALQRNEGWCVCVCNGFPFFSSSWPIPRLPCRKLMLRYTHA